MKDLTVMLEDQPGALAKMGEALGRAAINIEGICGITVEGRGLIHVLVEQPEQASRALKANGIEVAAENEVLIVEVEDRPGMLGNIARRLATAEINIQLAYLATSTRLVLGVDDLERAGEILNPT